MLIVMLRVVMRSVIMLNIYAKYRYAECYYADCYAKCHVVMQSVNTLSVKLSDCVSLS
jgi:hypothetical protein